MLTISSLIGEVRNADWIKQNGTARNLCGVFFSSIIFISLMSSMSYLFSLLDSPLSFAYEKSIAQQLCDPKNTPSSFDSHDWSIPHTKYVKSQNVRKTCYSQVACRIIIIKATIAFEYHITRIHTYTKRERAMRFN